MYTDIYILNLYKRKHGEIFPILRGPECQPEIRQNKIEFQ